MQKQTQIPLSLYFHIPFCKMKCVYCDFYSLPGREATIPVFVPALISEFQRTIDGLDPNDFQLSTIFFGGGTPSLLAPADLERIFTAIHKYFPVSPEIEITLEANPGEASFEKLRAFRKLGVNRLSLGIQSLQPELLRFMSRIHTAEQARQTFKAARKAGFTNINTDLIFAIPGQTKTVWLSDLTEVIKWAPEHISAYSLTVEEGTALHRWVANQQVKMLQENDAAEMVLEGRAWLANHGYQPYEISNYAKPGFACRHNLHYWTQVPYLGFGPSAHSYLNEKRWWNVCSLDGYLQHIANGRTVVAGEESLTTEQLRSEYIFTRLRLSDGISRSDYRRRFGADFETRHGKRLEKWLAQHIILCDDYYRLTGAGLLLADDIAADLMV